jgi:hypothetical protein
MGEFLLIGPYNDALSSCTTNQTKMSNSNGNGDTRIENNGFLVIAYYRDSPIRPTYHYFDLPENGELDPTEIIGNFRANPNLFTCELYALNLIDRWAKEPD